MVFEPGPAARAREHLDGARLGVAAEQQPARAAQRPGLDDLAVGRGDLGPGGDVEAGLDRAVVAERDAQSGVGAEQAALADRDHLGAAARQGAHDRGAAADVGAVADDHAGADAALDHRRAERAGVVVDEALVHDGRALREVGAEADAVGVGDPHAARDDVVDHARELVDAVDRQRAPGGAEAQPHRVDLRGVDGPGARPGDVRQHAEDPVEVGAVRADQAVREQVQAQVGVGGVGRRLGEIGDHGGDDRDADAAVLVAAGAADQVAGLRALELAGAALGGRALEAEPRLGEPGVEHPLAGEGGQADPPGALRLRHAIDPSSATSSGLSSPR